MRTAELCYFNRLGQLIWREPRGLARRLSGAAGLGASRRAAARRCSTRSCERLGSDAVRCGAPFRSSRMLARDQVEATLRRPRERYANSSSARTCLIGADGIHSTVRRQFYPDEGPPNWNGQVLWRAVSQGEPYLTGRSMFMAGSNRTKFVAYPITEPGADGLCTINWIAELNLGEQPMLEREDWNRRGDRAQFAHAFASWRFDWLDIPALIAATDDVFEFPMVDRDPLERWTHDRVTLLGDAAHAMYPIGSNGASQAILDAWALGGALRAQHGSRRCARRLRGRAPARDQRDRRGQPQRRPGVRARPGRGARAGRLCATCPRCSRRASSRRSPRATSRSRASVSTACGSALDRRR